MANINIISYNESNGRLREIYDDLFRSRGKLAQVHMLQSLRPESIVKHMDLYMEIMYSKSPLTRAEREMMAVVVSITNNCAYCLQHHATALNQYWKDESRIISLKNRNDNDTCLSRRESELCSFAESLTLEPASAGDSSKIKLMKSSFTDLEILDATLVVAYFNFVNRIVLALGAELEADKGEGYKY